MEDTLRKEVEAVVAAIFSEQEESEKRKQIEDTLTQSAETIEALTESLESKTEELKVVEATVVEKTSKIDNLNTELEAARKEITDLTEALSKSVEDLSSVKKDIATKERMSELASLSVVTNVEVQTTKVREMTDEVFASYKDELVSLRKAVVDELAKTAATIIDTNTSTDAIVIPPANISATDIAAAALNLEVSNNDIKDKYKKLGQAMADQMK
jgi:chromosome segregation ATPase